MGQKRKKEDAPGLKEKAHIPPPHSWSEGPCCSAYATKPQPMPGPLGAMKVRWGQEWEAQRSWEQEQLEGAFRDSLLAPHDQQGRSQAWSVPEGS